MKIITIAKCNGYELVSYGNGWGYAFKRGTLSIWLQDEDATRFRDEFDAFENSRPDMPTAAILAELWAQYEGIASEEKQGES